MATSSPTPEHRAAMSLLPLDFLFKFVQTVCTMQSKEASCSIKFAIFFLTLLTEHFALTNEGKQRDLLAGATCMHMHS